MIQQAIMGAPTTSDLDQGKFCLWYSCADGYNRGSCPNSGLANAVTKI